MQDLIALVLHLVGLYLALAMMVMGFVIMIGGLSRSGSLGHFGASWAGSVARLLFLQPFAVLGNGLAKLLSRGFVGIGQLLAALGKTFITHLVDPIVIVIGKMLRRVLFPRRH